MLADLRIPVVVAPMAGGASTPELVTAVGAAGGFGFLAAGYLSAEAVAGHLAKTRELGPHPFGVNLFVPGPESAADLRGYAASLRAEADRYAVALGDPRWEDDDYAAKLDLVVRERVPVVSFTFGCPEPAVVRRLRDNGIQVVVTVTTPAEARIAVDAGADVLCVQGADAGAHRGLFVDDGSPAGGPSYGLLTALRLVLEAVDVPVIATGGLMHGADIAAVLTAGAVAAQLGTAFLRCPEAGTAAVHREALAGDRPTEFTRAFTGRPARGLVNRFLVEHSADAPSAYPQLHHLTKPLRAAANRAGDPEATSLWAGQAYSLCRDLPAAELLARLDGEARDAVSRARRRWP
ncbi:nitronate monooxygenase [Allokutzneria sp. A3M-2-11 16]|uniref:NAD(P)H-dependent flavin oxidoreductase n=1 Tax=Allokutzneria sp. A3M-2-11 16 TaxID=2962043 RepID=UPI0020B72BBC|nr:nitronate monooxygenase [Allokutzneria sp. A3M-2-11 16]MCP3801000.1 nitronate monooxygenase [Allokutzneria sp. A3M-2-11 16]